MKTKTPVHYVSKEELAELVKTYQLVKRRMKPSRLARLIEVLTKIASGVWDKWEFTDSKDDFVQDVLVIFFAKALRTVDPERNCFSYFTTCAVYHGNKMRMSAIRDRHAETRFGLEYISRQTDAAEQAADDDLDPPEAPACVPSSPPSPPSGSSALPPEGTSKRLDRPHRRARGPSAISRRASTSETPAD